VQGPVYYQRERQDLNALPFPQIPQPELDTIVELDCATRAFAGRAKPEHNGAFFFREPVPLAYRSSNALHDQIGALRHPDFV
jgi:hypothetical protein